MLETTSKTTRREDAGKKNKIYSHLGIGEYFLYDPRGDWLRPRLQGYRLVNGKYAAIPPAADGSILSQELGIRFVLEDGDLVMFDARSGERLLSQEELARKLEDELATLRDAAKKPNGERRKNGK